MNRKFLISCALFLALKCGFHAQEQLEFKLNHIFSVRFQGQASICLGFALFFAPLVSIVFAATNYLGGSLTSDSLLLTSRYKERLHRFPVLPLVILGMTEY